MDRLPVTDVVVIGGGFSGLTAAYRLAERGHSVTVLEAEGEVGGLAAAFDVGGEKLDRFYHHWFTNDADVMGLIADLGLGDRVSVNPTNTGVYYANSLFRLSTPLDVLKFSPLGLIDRVRLGLLALRARRVKDWRALEHLSAKEWLRELGGENVYRIVWEPLLRGKFGPYAEDVSAVWFWNKLKLRGGSRGRRGEERLAYIKGGFVAIAEALVARISSLGGQVELNAKVTAIAPVGDAWRVTTSQSSLIAKRVIATPALPIIAEQIQEWAPADYLEKLRRIRYIGNVCLVMELAHPLSSTYWINVNDPSFPFVGVIEHTNFETPGTYGGRHIVYLSKYLPHTDALYSMDAEALLKYALPYLKTMFPAFELEWVRGVHLWRAKWSQPVVERHYSRLIPPIQGPKPGLFLCSMAQIYPEDRGTNYAIREATHVAREVAVSLRG